MVKKEVLTGELYSIAEEIKKEGFIFSKKTNYHVDPQLVILNKNVKSL